MKRPLTIQNHPANENICRIPELTIRQLPECEGGGWFFAREDAEEIVAAVNKQRKFKAESAQ